MIVTQGRISYASQRSSQPGSGRKGIEVAGTPLQKTAQRIIHRNRAKLNDLEGAVSFGRSVAAFLPELATEALPGLAEQFRRVLLLGKRDDAIAAAQKTVSSGAEISGEMPIISANDTQFARAARLVLSKFEASTSGRFSVLDEDASPLKVRKVQGLQIAVGLTPLPGAFLRGAHGRVSTVMHHNADGHLSASATLVSLADVGAEFAETAILVGVSVDPGAQGRGLGSAITASGLIEARRRLGARRVLAVVSPSNKIALHTNAKFGMHPVPGHSAIYVEIA